MLAIMQCIFNLIVHNLPSLTVCHPSTISCFWWTRQTYQQRCLGSIPGSLSFYRHLFCFSYLQIIDMTFDDKHVLNAWNVPVGLHEPKWLNLELGKKSEPSQPGLWSFWPQIEFQTQIRKHGERKLWIHGRLLIGPCSCSHQMLSRVFSGNEVKEWQERAPNDV